MIVGRMLRGHELRTEFRLGGTYRGLYRVLGEGYTTDLVQAVSVSFVAGLGWY